MSSFNVSGVGFRSKEHVALEHSYRVSSETQQECSWENALHDARLHLLKELALFDKVGEGMALTPQEYVVHLLFVGAKLLLSNRAGLDE